MKDDIRRLLDGELAPGEAESLFRPVQPGDRFEAGVMARVRARPAPRRSAWTWLRIPRVSILSTALAVAAAAILSLAPSWLSRSRAGDGRGQVVARLALVAPLAQRVAVAGDFNGWNPEAAPLRRGPGGTWSVELALPRGRHQYQFVVDGRWTADPVAAVTQDDDFGSRNAVLDL